jgi:hypothetical protein
VAHLGEGDQAAHQRVLTVPGTSGPEQTVNLMFQRIKTIEAAINVPEISKRV